MTKLSLSEILGHSEFIPSPKEIWKHDIFFTMGSESYEEYKIRTAKMVIERDEAIASGVDEQEFYKKYIPFKERQKHE